MASRLSTQANLGNMSKMNEVIRMVIGNVALVQVQATVAAFIVSMFALSVGTIMDGTFMLSHAFLVTASSMFTATTSCFFLGESTNDDFVFLRNFNVYLRGEVSDYFFDIF